MNKDIPTTRTALKKFVWSNIGVRIPDRRMCDGHSSPMDYLWHAFSAKQRDCIVWANRAGGKTYLAALATLLDCIFRQEFHIRILGGSKDQSSMMYNHFLSFLHPNFDSLLEGQIRKTACNFTNGSSVQILTQSERNVRGQHVQRLRCDELDLFDRDVFNAAKFITESKGTHTGTMELLSTMHRPYGLMHEQVNEAQTSNVPVFKWCVWEVVQKCRDRNCSRCPLWSDCAGKAKKASGYFSIDDCLDFQRRASRQAWECEMLCLRPSRENVVFGDFNVKLYVGAFDYDPNLPLYRTIDFGYVNPFVCLFIQVDRFGVVRVVDEYVARKRTVSSNAQKVIERTRVMEERVSATFCDPSGAARNDIDGSSAVKELRSAGIRVKYRKSSIHEGIELIRRHLLSGDGLSRLIISNNCPRLIEAMECYHYPDQAGELPVKDGVYDHPIDALRYFFVNYFRKGKTGSRAY